MKHGFSGYTNHRCRCDICTEGNRLHHAQLRLVGREPPEHGTPNGYNNYSCRCDPCTEAQSEYTRARRKAQR